MGHNPIPPYRPPTAESFHLGRARQAYLDDEISIDRFEELAAHVLRGGYLSQTLEPRVTPAPGEIVPLPPGPDRIVRRS